MGIILRALATAIAIWVVALILPEHIKWGGVDYGLGEPGRYLSLLFTGLVLGILNAFVRPVVLLVSMPLTCLTLGLFTFVVNALMLWVLTLIPQLGFTIDNFLWALIASVLISLVSGLVSKVVH